MKQSCKTKRMETTFYDVESERLPHAFDQTRIVLLSDLHCNQYGKHNEELLYRIQEVQPNVIMISGDMVNGNGRKSHIPFELISALAKLYPVYYVPGNHEVKMAVHKKSRHAYHRYRRELRSCGVHYLNNKSALWEYRGASVRITGLNLKLRYYHKFWKPTIMPSSYPQSVIGEADANGYQILLAHHPDYYDEYCRWGADLTLCGHMHGGIIRIPFLGGLISPSLEMFPTYDAGIYRRGIHRMVVSRGLGLHTVRFRLFNPPELACIKLHCKNKG